MIDGRKSTPSLVPAGLVGCGDIAGRYASNLSRDSQSRIELTCATDVSADHGAAFAREHRLQFVPSVEKLLERPIALVCICTPNATHAQLAQQCLEAGKHVVLEHPMATTSDAAERLQETVARTGRQLFVVRQRRFLRTIQLLRAALRMGALGTVVEAEMSVCWNRRASYFKEKPWRGEVQSGGVLMNQASHFLDILLYLFGDPLSVEGCLGNIRNDIQCEDSALGVIHFAGGLRVFVECTTGAPEGHNWTSLSIKGSRLELELNGQAWERFGSPVPPEVAQLEELLAPPLTGDHAGFLERVGRRLANDDVEIVDGEEGLRAVRLIENIYSRFSRDDDLLRAHFAGVFNQARKLELVSALAGS